MKIYVSHSIRGTKGVDATEKDMQQNCERIKVVVKQLRKEFPTIEFYVPAESEPFVNNAHKKKYLTEKQILDVDCSIIDECDMVIIYMPPDDNILQGGRLVEYNHCRKTNKPVFSFNENTDLTLLRQLMGN